MRAYKMQVVIPEDRHLSVEVPRSLDTGPAELIFLVPAAPKSEPIEAPTRAPGHLARLAAQLAEDPRPFQELSREERLGRLRRLMGAGRGLCSTSEEFSRAKNEEIEIEQRHVGR